MEIEENVEDAVDDDEVEIPPTQMPDSPPPRRTVRNMRTSTPSSSSGKVSKNLHSASSSKKATSMKRPAPKPVKVTQPKASPIFLTQKKKNNISASFMTALANRGLSEELKKTAR